ncbi:DUF4019 domain-containing protein [Pseudoalteromonas shioyasakiensis]|uniref:DUF4019 domain-containing protein n=1 Tax=Pseudoalteromonas TaxID=53246 RepID=UPI00102019B0|nr:MULTISPECIES: DUF4019 domain-containing protein [Pseudoalteromonas]MCQ8883438.1 DUF4019 domain-containing protein [Pseudoalteromonas shioyasakiensis]QWV04514.1 DUF4019 domain-containing protein [Pseudoalteromonas shioyasakiensis]RZD21341.1 DUF4019 domain-containing protein [Pseudoalteromonas sp. MEBiC 03485]
MRKMLLLITFLSCFCANAEELEVINRAKSWLVLIDNGQYQQSWQQTDSLFKQAMPQSNWSNVLKQVRVPLGKVILRKNLSLMKYDSLPGTPDGEYVIIQFQSQFMNKEQAVETISLSKNSGQWQPLGYFIN